MRLDKPRLEPLTESEWPPEVFQPAGKTPPLNIFTTLARHPDLMRRFQVFGAHVLAKSTLPARERELVILRTGFRCNSAYEFHQHTRIGLAAGLTRDEIAKLQRDASEWTGPDAALVRAADELHDDQMISDATWKELSARWSEQQLMDLVFAIGQYTLVSMALNTFGVQIEDGTKGFPK
jgi:alkylhydroperoxidase family enzyme